MRLLVTRPGPDGERTAAVLRARGHDVIVAPVLRIDPLAEATFGTGPYAALILTSANAARALARHPRRDELLGLAAFAVGARTTEAARAAGFADVTSADGDAGDLVRLLAGRLAGTRLPLLYLAGEDQAGDLGRDLAPHGLRVETVAIYRAVASAELVAAVAAVLPGIDAVLHYSRRSAAAFLAAVTARPAGAGILAATHYCLSDAVAEPLVAAGAAVKIAPAPTENALLGLLSLA